MRTLSSAATPRSPAPRRRGAGLLGGALLLGVLVCGGAASCGGEEGGVPCATAAECDDGNPCTADTCLERGCARTKLADGPGALPQMSGDCHRLVCKDGAVALEEDPSDPTPDGDECTIDSCINGVAAHLPDEDGAVCHLPGSAGICVSGGCTFPVCGPESPCNDGNPCTADGCNEEGTMCIAVPLDDIPTPLLMQTLGDCRELRCVKGVSKAVADDADLPGDGNPCTLDLCEQGKPKHPYAPAGTSCGEAMVCDATGHCGP